MAVQTYILREERDRAFALGAVAKARLGMQVKISKPTRTNEQNKLLHSCLTDIAKQLAWPPPPANSGELRDLEFWKRACTLSWLQEINAHPEIIMSLDGTQFGILVPHTSDLDTEECSSLCDWIFAFGAHNGVVFTEKKPDIGPDPPPRESDR